MVAHGVTQLARHGGVAPGGPSSACYSGWVARSDGSDPASATSDGRLGIAVYVLGGLWTLGYAMLRACRRLRR